MRRLSLVILCGLAVGGLALPLQAADLIGPNLITNPGFEEGDEKGVPVGWQPTVNPPNSGTVSRDDKVYLVDKRAVKLEVPNTGGVSLRSANIPVEGGKRYLLSVAFRQEGFGPAGKYSGVSANLGLDWLDAAGKSVGRAAGVGFPYNASPWDLRDNFNLAPPGSASAVITVNLGNQSEKQTGANIPSTLWLDQVQLRPYSPPPTPEWAQGDVRRIVEGGVETSPVRWHQLSSLGYVGGNWSKIVADDKSSFGTAVASPAGCGEGIMAHSPYFDQVHPGLYRLVFRCKVADITRKEAAGAIDMDSQFCSQRAELTLYPSDFAAANTYQDFTLDFLIRSPGWWDFRIFTKGNQVFTADMAKVFPLQLFNDRELLDLYPGSQGTIPDNLRPHKSGPWRVMVVAGPLYDYWSLGEAMHLTDYAAEIKTVWVQKSRNQVFLAFPETAEDLFKYNLVLLCGVNVGDMNLRQKHMLAEYVRRGGGMVMLGGHKAFERGGLRGSLLEDLLPVTVPSGDLPPLVAISGGAPLAAGVAHPVTRYVDWSAGPRVYFRHDLTPREGAQVIATAGGQPAIVVGNGGAGRVACVGLTTFGNPAEGQVPFWQWPRWTLLLRDLCWWVAGEDQHFRSS